MQLCNKNGQQNVKKKNALLLPTIFKATKGFKSFLNKIVKQECEFPRLVNKFVLVEI